MKTTCPCCQTEYDQTDDPKEFARVQNFMLDALPKLAAIEQYARCKTLAIQALNQMRGDDLFRAQCAFRGMSEKQMAEQHGHSGKTRAQILKEYEEWELKVSEALAWLNSL